MNRRRPWLMVGLVFAAGAASSYLASDRWAARQLAQVDRELAAARAQVEAAQRLLARQVVDVALLAGRDPALAAALAEPPAAPRGRRPAKPPPRPDPSALVEGAVRGAARASGVDLSRGMVASLEAGGMRHGHVRYGDTIYYAAAVPVKKGTALSFGLPIDSQWTEALEKTTGVGLALFSAPGKSLVALPPAQAEGLAAAAARPGGAPVGLGRLGRVKPSSPGFLPALPLLFAAAPAHRVQALALAGLPGAALVLSAPTEQALAPVAAYQQISLALVALLFLAALAVALLPGAEAPGRLPRELLSAAERISRGDFGARVPRLSGATGVLGAALNRAAEAAGQSRPAAAPPPAAPPTPAPGPARAGPASDLPASEAAEETTERGFVAGLSGRAAAAVASAPAGPAPIPAAQATGKLDGSELARDAPAAAAPARRTGTALFEAARPPVAAPPPASAPPRAAAAPPAGPSPTAAPVAAARAPVAAPPAAAPPGSEEEHWRQVFQDFLKVREQCGEPFEGLTFDRFRQKLQKNKEGLLQKYACRAVRFEVYVKDGKAALKATPVR